MFGMGFSEILIILVIGIIFLGPEKLPEAMVKIARFFNMFKKTINEAKDSIDQELRIEELKKEAMEYKRKLHETTDSVKHSIYSDDFEELKNSASDFKETLEESVKNPIEKLESAKDLSLLEDMEDDLTEPKKKKKKEKENREDKADV